MRICIYATEKNHICPINNKPLCIMMRIYNERHYAHPLMPNNCRFLWDLLLWTCCQWTMQWTPLLPNNRPIEAQPIGQMCCCAATADGGGWDDGGTTVAAVRYGTDTTTRLYLSWQLSLGTTASSRRAAKRRQPCIR